MAVKKKTRSRWWSRLHFLVRFAGLTGLLCVGVGVALAYLEDILPNVLPGGAWDNVATWDFRSPWEFIRDTVLGEAAVQPILRVAVGLLAGGVVAALFALLIEVLVVLGMVAGRRSAFGFNATLQTALAVALLVGINVYSFRHYLRLDWTRNQQFTLPPDIQTDLSQLSREEGKKTTIVVYQRHKTFGQLSDKPDAFDYAAERKVVEKVKDLVEQFREFGPQFRVEVLDVEEEGFDRKLQALTADNKALKEAIDSAPENSIFFQAGDKVQRLSFNDFYQLDKTASRKEDNLVLLYQGVEPFARKVLNIDEKRPKVALATIHEVLTTQGPEDYGMPGLKKALTERGFEVRDIILKKWSEVAPPEPAVYTYDESKFERLEEQLTELNADVKNLEKDVQSLTETQKLWQTASLEDLTKKYAKELGGRKVNEAFRQRQLAVWEQNAAILKVLLAQSREERDATAKEKAGLSTENTAEQRRMTDVKAKLERTLADCDLLIIPRMTIRNLSFDDRISPRFYRLDDTQVAAIKDFLKAGKPVLACFGPTNEHPADQMRMPPTMPGGKDELEEALSQLGIKFGNQTILFNVESKSLAERRTGLLVSGANVEVPPVEFEGKAETPGLLAPTETAERSPNPIRASMRIAERSLGKSLDLRVRYPRPIYYEPRGGKTPAFEPEFILTSAACWNEDQPFPTRERTPRFEPPKPDDPNKGKVAEKRRGPFPIGVAVETTLPEDWYGSSNVKPATVRVAAIGNGGLFTGKDLSPAKEQLLLNTCNWLLGRDDLLTQENNPPWRYPRVTLSPRAQNLWHWGAWVGLPGLFAYLGLVVVMVRRLR
jgi:hypothetical protein